MTKNQLLTSCAVLAGLSLAPSQNAYAGWSGQMNGTGFGRATANVTSPTGGLANPTITTGGPSAAVNPLGASFKATSGLPSGSSAGTTSQITGSAGYIWKAVTTAAGGDRTDNDDVENIMNVIPQAATKLEITTSLGNDRVLTFDGEASGGTGLLLRVYNTAPPQNSFSNLSLDEPDVPDFSQFDPIFNQPLTGEGLVDPISGRAEHFIFTFQLPPKQGNDENIWVVIDGFATSAVPDSGAFMGLAFGLTVAGLAVARRYSVA